MTTRPERKRLTINDRAERTRPTIDGIAPLPNIERGLSTAWQDKAQRRTVETLRTVRADAETRTGDIAHRAAVCENGDGRGADIASFLAPVAEGLDLDDAGMAGLAGFARKLLEGGRPKRGSQSGAFRNVDMD